MKGTQEVSYVQHPNYAPLLAQSLCPLPSLLITSDCSMEPSDGNDQFQNNPCTILAFEYCPVLSMRDVKQQITTFSLCLSGIYRLESQLASFQPFFSIPLSSFVLSLRFWSSSILHPALPIYMFLLTPHWHFLRRTLVQFAPVKNLTWLLIVDLTTKLFMHWLRQCIRQTPSP